MTKMGVTCSHDMHDALLKSVNVTCHVVVECKQRQSPGSETNYTVQINTDVLSCWCYTRPVIISIYNYHYLQNLICQA